MSFIPKTVLSSLCDWSDPSSVEGEHLPVAIGVGRGICGNGDPVGGPALRDAYS